MFTVSQYCSCRVFALAELTILNYVECVLNGFVTSLKLALKEISVELHQEIWKINFSLP